MSIDDKHGDNDLKAYLDGRDGVSAAYRKTAQEEPPRALDELILKAARKQAPPSTELWYTKRRPYALAASFMIAVVAVSLYFSELDEIVVPEAIERATVRTVELQRADAPAKADAAVADTAATTPESLTANVALAPAFETRQLAPAVRTVGADPVAPPAAPAVDLNREAFARVAEPVAVVIDGPLLEAIEAEAAGAQAPQVATAASTLEEITVTGSRIMRRDEGDVSYRNSREDWLDEIRFMTDEFESRARLITARAAAARIEEQLNEEIELYLEAYPEADIEAELEALEE